MRSFARAKFILALSEEMASAVEEPIDLLKTTNSLASQIGNEIVPINSVGRVTDS